MTSAETCTLGERPAVSQSVSLPLTVDTLYSQVNPSTGPRIVQLDFKHRS